jgi:hypothetical protein
MLTIMENRVLAWKGRALHLIRLFVKGNKIPLFMVLVLDNIGF